MHMHMHMHMCMHMHMLLHVCLCGIRVGSRFPVLPDPRVPPVFYADQMLIYARALTERGVPRWRPVGRIQRNQQV